MESVQENCPRQEPTRKAKLLQTAIVLITTLILGILNSQEGVVFLDLILLTNSNIATGSGIFTSGSIGFLVGTLLIVPLFDKFNNDMLYCGCILLTGISTIVIPWCASIYLMMAVVGLKNFFVGPADSGFPVIFGKIWQKDAGPYIQAAFFLFAIGGIGAPFINEPFLVGDGQRNVTLVIPSANESTSNMNVTFEEIQPMMRSTSNAGWVDQPNQQGNVSLEFVLQNSQSNVYIPYAITGTLILLVGASLGLKILFISSGQFDHPPKNDAGIDDAQRRYAVESFPVKAKILCFVILGILLFSYGSMEKILGSFLVAFITKHLRWTQTNVSFGVTLYLVTFAAGRLLVIFVVKLVKLSVILLTSIVGIVGACVAMFLFDYLSWCDDAWWVLLAVSGFVLSYYMGTALCWLEENLTPLSGKVLSFIYVVRYVGVISHMSLLGYLFDYSSPVWFIYLLLIHSGILGFLSIVLYIAVHWLKKLYCP